MGVLDRFGLTRKRFDYLSRPVDILSPWADSSGLEAILPNDLFGDIDLSLPMTREQAIKIPSVAKARNLLVSTITRFPLVALRPDSNDRVNPQPLFLQRTNGKIGPAERMAWTVDDLFFHGVSLWLIDRNADGSVQNAHWCPSQLWKITDGNILVNDQPIDERSIILFNPPFEGLLRVGDRTLHGARDMESAWTDRMKNPIPMIELRITDDDNITQEEADAYVASWKAKHLSGKGGVGLTPKGMELVDHGAVQHELFTEGRNAVRTDIGSHTNIRTAMLDGTIGVDSLTYTTKDGERNAFYEFDLPFWTVPIEERLSMDDVVPSTQRVRFDKYDAFNLPNPTGEPTED